MLMITSQYEDLSVWHLFQRQMYASEDTTNTTK